MRGCRSAATAAGLPYCCGAAESIRNRAGTPFPARAVGVDRATDAAVSALGGEPSPAC